MYNRLIQLDKSTSSSFFLWGPRQAGKTTLLRQRFSDVLLIDLLKSDEFIRFSKEPWRLREELSDSGRKLVLIDEVQKVPALLDEVHWLIENKQIIFGLCGSSARKLRRGHANLLGGRALRYELRGFCAKELGRDFDLDKALNAGYLPNHYLAKQHTRLLKSYVSDYLKEEIAAEGLLRNLSAFTKFLDFAALADTNNLAYTTFARDVGVSSETIKNYYDILEDTLIGTRLEAYTKKAKRRVVKGAKFYFSDIGTVNSLSRRSKLQQGTPEYGKAFENWIHHELRCHSHYTEQDYPITYWQLPSSMEVDFILGDMEVAVEVKSSCNINSKHLKGLHSIVQDFPKIKHRIVVCQEDRPRKTEDNITILPYMEFIKRLWAGEIIN